MDELAYGLRVNLHYALVQSVNDAGQAQTATVISHDGMPRADIEVMQPYGFASSPPGDGAIAPMLSVGGDAAQFILLPLCCPATRFGGLLAGESAQYAYDGSRVHIRQGGTIEILAGNTIVGKVGATTSLTINDGTIVGAVGTTTILTITDGTIVAAVSATTLTVAAAGVTVVGTLNCGNIVSTGSITATGNITPNV